MHFSLSLETSQEYPFSPLIFIVLEIIAKVVRQEKVIPGKQIRKEEIKLSVHR